MGKNIVDVVSCECLDPEYWRIKYKIGNLISDDIFKRVTKLGYVEVEISKTNQDETK